MVLSPGAGRTSAAGVLAFFAACPPCLCFAFLPPIPPTPFPGGEGGDFRLFYARGFAPCIPGAGRGAALGKGANHAPGGGVPGWLPAKPPFSLLFCPPHPPDPLPGGKGETKVILCKGLRPLHPRGWAGRGTGKGGEPRARWGACPLQGRVRGAPGARRRACPVGCLPTLPLLYFLAPIPPSPFPAGRGRFFVYFAGGYRPRHPCG